MFSKGISKEIVATWAGGLGWSCEEGRHEYEYDLGGTFSFMRLPKPPSEGSVDCR